MKVLVSDNLADIGIEIIQQTPGIDVDVNTGLAPEALKEIIGAYDGLIIRSATKVTADLIAAADKLKVVGRAGIGLDNVDIPAASKRGIVVMNTPDGNTITTAEHALALLMSLTRNVPQATASLKDGRWEKKKMQGREIFNKTLGLVGAGHIGKIVAERARGLQMKVIVFDPYLQPHTLEKLEIEAVTSLEELLSRSDFITIHTPKTEETTNLINKETLAMMKPGAMLVNCARGGIVNEDDLYDALVSGHLGGAALDVFSTEPPGESKLMSLPNFICTPHLGASTREAQDNVARDVANQIIAYLLEDTVKNAVNMPNISGVLMNTLKPFVDLTEKLGLLQAQLSEGAIKEVQIHYIGKVSTLDTQPLTTALLKGLLTPILKDDVNFVNAPFVAADRGIKVIESKTATSTDFTNLVNVVVTSSEGAQRVSGTIFGGGRYARIVRINDFYFEAVPEGYNIFVRAEDVPGTISRITGVLGDHNINISRMQVGDTNGQATNVILMATSTRAGNEVLKALKQVEQVYSVQRVDF